MRRRNKFPGSWPHRWVRPEISRPGARAAEVEVHLKIALQPSTCIGYARSNRLSPRNRGAHNSKTIK